MSAAELQVEVVFALPLRQTVKRVSVPAGARVRDAIEASGILAEYPEARGLPAGVGVWGRRAAPDDLLREGDRIEIFRPLVADPKDSRRARAERKAIAGRPAGDRGPVAR
jgi:hypothetical protein